MLMGRRSLLLGSGVAVVGAVFPFRHLFGRPRTSPNRGRFGPLRTDPAGILDLPSGFSYRILQRRGALMSDGYQVPGAFDGMGCFAGPNDTLVLMRNHELDRFAFLGPGPYRSGQKAPSEAYNRNSLGGVTRLVVDRQTFRIVSSNLVLAGTSRNCSGGPSPWGWLSCEESNEDGHGYVFLCSTEAAKVSAPRRIAGYGRYRHEAAAVDPTTNIAYFTEDETDGCIYRFVPRSKDRPFEGKLSALAVVGQDNLETGRGLRSGATFDVRWVDIDDPEAKNALVRVQGHAKGAARFSRGEGIWYSDGELWMTMTSGGPVAAGQVFRLSCGKDGKADRLTLVSQSTSTAALNMPDNVTMMPSGELLLAEDCLGGPQYLRVVSRDGRVSDFARNALSVSELSGLCFSPDGKTLFLNVYLDGITLAVNGPFDSTLPAT